MPRIKLVQISARMWNNYVEDNIKSIDLYVYIFFTCRYILYKSRIMFFYT